MSNEEDVELGMEDSTSMHWIAVPLEIESDSGRRAIENVAMQPLGGRRYRVGLSPGFYQGIAAGDEVEIDPSSKTARVIKRGGNIAVQVFYENIPLDLIEDFKERAVGLGATVDGELDGLIILTFSVKTGFASIESLMESLPADSVEWMYGNVYADDGSPLNWWGEEG